MKKLLYIALLITLLLVPLQYINAESFADANDIFKVITPLPNSKVGGTIDIEWSSFDDDQTAIPYYIQLLDGATCKTTSYGRINSNSASNSSNTTNNKVSWDTHKTISTQSLNDGNYCLQICSAFKNTDAYYSICNARVITVVNVNKLPTISSTPTTLTINESEAWQYQIQSSDVDSDNLKYYLVFAPDFLEINTQTGLIKTKNNASRISENINIAEYRVVIGVDDGVSGTTTQEFTIRVEKGRVANLTAPAPTEPTQPTPEPQNTPSQISINTPKENTELSGVQNFIEWSVYDPDGIQEITLNYSSDLETWTEIVSKTEDSFARYSWDVTAIADGKYYLQIKVKDKKDEVVAKVSKPFLIKNAPVVVEEKKPLIVNIKPENDKVLTESPLNITGDFAPAEGEEINPDSFKLSLNDKDISEDCIKNLSGFQCTIKNPLAVGEYSIKAEIQDLNTNKGTFESKFSLQEKKVETTNNTSTSSSSNALVIILVVIILLIALVGLPWFFISYSKRKLRTTKTQVQQPGNAANYAYPQASVTFSEPQKPVQFAPIPQPSLQPTQNAEQPTVPAKQNNDQSKSFDDFMNTYSFGSQTAQPTQIKPAPVTPVPITPIASAQIQQTKQIGDIKPKQVEPKTSIKDTFNNLTQKVSNFIPKSPEVPKVEQESQPVLVNNNPNLSQNIQNAYSNGTSTTETPSSVTQTFVKPVIIDEKPVVAVNAQPEPISSPELNTTNQEYVTPTTADSSEEELKKMYPELYGAVPQEQDTTATNATTATSATQEPTTGDYYEPKPKD